MTVCFELVVPITMLADGALVPPSWVESARQGVLDQEADAHKRQGQEQHCSCRVSCPKQVSQTNMKAIPKARESILCGMECQDKVLDAVRVVDHDTVDSLNIIISDLQCKRLDPWIEVRTVDVHVRIQAGEPCC